MALALARRGLRRRPRGPYAFPGTNPAFDPAHPLSAGCRFSGVAHSGGFVNLLSGRAGTKVNGPSNVIDGALGQAINSVSSTDGYNFSGQPTTNDTSVTFGGFFRWTASGTSILLQSSSGVSGIAFGPITTGNQLCFFFDGGTGNPISTPLVSFAVGTPYFVAMSCYNAGGGNFNSSAVCVDLLTGKTYSGNNTTASTGPVAPNGTCMVANGNGGFRSARGNVPAVMFNAVYTPLQGLLKWAADPWSFWYPR